MKIFAHRGLQEQYPENSLRAIQAALDKDFGVEVDLRLNQDKDFVLIHDKNLKRLFGINQNIYQAKTDDIEKRYYLNYFPKESLVLFEKLCRSIEKISNKHLAIHLKVEEQTKAGLKLIVDYFKQFNLFNKSFIFDLTKESTKKIKELDERIKVGFIISDYRFDKAVYLWQEIKNDLDIFDIVWAAEFRNFYSQAFIDEVHDNQKEIIAVSPELHLELGHPRARAGYQKTWEDLIAWGVDGICTDYPQEFISYLKP